MKKRTLLKLLCSLLILTFSLGLAACTEGRLQNPDAVRPSNRLPEGDGSILPAFTGWSFAKTVQGENYTLAHLQIGSCLEETEDSHYRYRARVLDSWKIPLPEEITLYQTYACRYEPRLGTGYPAYTYGNEVVLILYFSATEDRETYYVSHGVDRGFYVVRDDAGETYLVALYDRLGGSVAYDVPRYDDPELLKELEENFLESDPIWKNLKYSFNYVFRYEDLKAFVQNSDTDFSTHPEYDAPEVLTAPADFDFSVEYGYGPQSHWNSVNTYDETLTKDLIAAGTKTVNFVMPEEMKNRIYTKLMTCNLASVTEAMFPKNLVAEGEHESYVTPCTEFEIRFTLNGMYYRITGCGMASFYPNHEQARNVTSFLDYVIPCVESTPEYQAMPPVEGGYM